MALIILRLLTEGPFNF